MKRVKQVLLESDLDLTRFFLALAATLWGVLLFWPGDTFSRQTYSVMKSIASEWVWASAFLIQGLLAFWSLFKSRNTTPFFLLDALLGCVLWSSSCIAMLVSVYPLPAAISAEISAAFASWWALVRYSLDCKINLMLECLYKRFKWCK